MNHGTIGGVGILGTRYVLGEHEEKVEALVNRGEVLRQHNMPDNAALWGWDLFRRSMRTHAALACDSAAQTLSCSGLRADEIDALVICCGDGLTYFQQNAFLAELSGELELRSEFVTWIGGTGCVSLCSAVRVATTLVESGACANVLTIAVDRCETDAARFQRFGVFSDGACSFVVRAHGHVDYALSGVAVASSLALLRSGGQDLAEKFQLIQSVFKRAGAGAAFPYAGSVLLSSNVFLPIQQLESSALPVRGLVPFRRNTMRYGHCSSADPFINLVDFFADAENHATRTAVIASSASGHFGVLLLERRAPAKTAVASEAG